MFGRQITFFSQLKAPGGALFSLSGGTETSVGSDKVLTFTTNGTLQVIGSGTVSVLVVGAGQNGGAAVWGGSSATTGFGGNGGQINYQASYAVSAGNYSITVGQALSLPNSSQPGSSIFGTITSQGGDNANTIGAQGGASRNVAHSTSFTDYPGSSGTNGTAYNITGASVVYASGGGSGAYSAYRTLVTVLGGSGGTNAGAGGDFDINLSPLVRPGNPAINYGSGGGGSAVSRSGGNGTYGGQGYNGVVIIRYTPR